MRHRTFRRAAVLAAAVFLASATIASADTLPADGDPVNPGMQTTINLGQASPGQVVNRSITFYLTCFGTGHAPVGTIFQLDPGSVSVPLDGAVTATSTTVGPVPAGWPTGTQACDSPAQTLASNGPSVVSLTMPTTPGTHTFTVSWNRSSSTGLTKSTGMTFTVQVVGNSPPQLTVPSAMTVEASGPSGATATFAATATDAEDNPDPTPSCLPASGSTFPIGMTTVGCTVTDGRGLSVSGKFDVTVQDLTSPTLTTPADQTVEATGADGATVTFAASASDVVDGSASVTCDHGSGDTFPLGNTKVTCSATDTAGNRASGTFTVTVIDTTAPTLGLPADQTAEATGASGASVTFITSANDIVSGSVPVNCDHASGATFPLGTTTVACSATDTAGNPASGSFHVTVNDTIAPSLVGMPSNLTLTTGNPAGTILTYTSPTATDVVDPSPSVSCTPASGSSIPVGTTTVTCTATDASHNSSSARFSALVGYATSTIWTATWGEPVASSGDVFVSNYRRTVPIKVSMFVNGTEQRSGHGASLAVVACGGGTPLVTGLDWDGGRWSGHLDTGRLAGPGCYLATASLDGHDVGFIELDMRGASSTAKANANHAN